MGFFSDLFGGKKRANVELVPDQIWMTTDAKFTGLAEEADKRSRSETIAILLVAHFPDVLARLEELVNQQLWDVPCKAVLASDLKTDLATSLNLDESSIIDVIFGERHPLLSVDDRIEAFADELPCRCRFSHHVSLEDAVLKDFLSDWGETTLRKMGLNEDEAIESQMVSRRIRMAQQKIEDRSLGTFDAASAAEWMDKNCPALF